MIVVAAEIDRAVAAGDVGSLASRAAERYGPASVAVDDAGQVLHFSGRTGMFIDPSGGVATLDLLALLRRDLRDVVRDLLRRAAAGEPSPTAYDVSFDTDGAVARATITVEPLPAGDDGGSRFVVLFRDVATGGADGAGGAARHADEPFRALATSVDHVLFVAAGAPLDWTYVNPRFAERTGMAEPGVLGRGWMTALHPDDVATLTAASGATTSLTARCRLRGADGSYRWFRYDAARDVGATTGVTRWHGAATDIEQQVRAEDRLRLLMGEFQHRVKNILAVVRSIFTRTVDSTADVDDLAGHFTGRLDALARTHNVLVRSSEGGVDLEEIAAGELFGHGGPDAARSRIEGPPVRLRAAAAETFGLLIHELATNAAKFGALANSKGRIAVSWRIVATAAGLSLRWQWRESGVAIVDPAPSRSGFGRELIDHVVPYQLGAATRLAFEPGGVVCSVELILTDRVALVPGTVPSLRSENVV